MFLNYKDLIYIPDLTIVSSTYSFIEHFKNIKYIYYSFLVTQIGTKFGMFFQSHRCDLHTKISHRNQRIFFTLQKRKMVII